MQAARHGASTSPRSAPESGRIDWAMLPIGGYAPRWFMAPQHIDPIEAVRAWEALGAQHLLAMHWGTFRLTDEAIGEPPLRLARLLDRAKRSISVRGCGSWIPASRDG